MYFHLQPNWDTDEYIEKMLKGSFKNEQPSYSTIEDCKQALEKAVIDRCMADVEVGLLLSGGLDSSIIGSIMHQSNVKKHLTATGTIKSFAVGQEGSPDIVAARAVSKFLGNFLEKKWLFSQPDEFIFNLIEFLFTQFK